MPPRRADVMLDRGIAANYNGAGVNNLIQTPTGIFYCVFINSASDVVFIKSTDGGLTWSSQVVVFAGTVTALAVWYDKWSGLASGLIHCAYQESGTDDTLYRTINTEAADALSTQTVIFAGASTLAGGALAITRARGGNVYCATMIDAGTEGGFFRLLNANVPNGAWGAARTTVWEAVTQDQIILVPGFAADNQDIMAIFWDASADEISRKIYDDSANTWGETSISGSMVDLVATTAFRNFDAMPDLSNSRIILVAWNNTDTANADLLGWIVTEAAITAFTTPVVLNGTDDQGLCNIGLDTLTGFWYVFYGGKSDGSEIWGVNFNLYYKVSQDAGTTWGPETLLTAIPPDNLPRMYICPLRWSSAFGAPCPVAWWKDLTFMMVNAPLPISPRAFCQVGI